MADTSPMLKVTSGMMRVTSCMIITLLVMLSYCAAAPAVRSEVDAWNFLEKYGYVRENRGMNLMERRESFSRYLMEMQRNAGIEETGQLDSDTIRLMNTPRCGVADVEHQIDDEFGQFSNSYKLSGGRWESNNLTFGFKSYTSDMSRDLQTNIIKESFGEWSKYVPLKFTEVAWKDAKMMIQFVTKDHYDGTPFDGSGKVLAHALPPRWGGTLCFDDDEKWSKDLTGVDTASLSYVAIHEIGHALGLGHSDNRYAMMYPYAVSPRSQLASDDIAGIRELYGN